MKFVFIIAIVAVAMIGVMVPSAFGETVSNNFGSMYIDESVYQIPDSIHYTNLVKVYGIIENTAKGDKGDILFTLPDGTNTSSSFLITTDGNYQSFLILDNNSMSGDYSVSVSYGVHLIGTLHFSACPYQHQCAGSANIPYTWDEEWVPVSSITNYEQKEAVEQRAAEQRAAEQRAAEQRAAEQRAAEQRAAEQRAAANAAAQQATSTYVNHEFGFSVTPPSGWIIDYSADLDKIDSITLPGPEMLPMIRYYYPDSNADFIYPIIGVMVINSGIEFDLYNAKDGKDMAEGFLNSLQKTGSTGSIISTEYEFIQNGVHYVIEYDMQMNYGLENLLPVKINAEAWLFKDGLTVFYTYLADPSEYDKFLDKFQESADTFYFKQQPIIEKEKEGGGCLIATATYSSELAPQVQQLRELRDNQLLQTESGTAFMGMFNDVYYSFSPVIADYERENPYFKEAVKLAITPMISSLSLMENANSESEVLSIGISVIMLNLGMYLGVPAIVVIGIRKRI